jgi:acyl-coenzyme A synthetase/AMP-(fatty) acid ligase
MIVVPRELSAFPAELVEFIELERISIWYSVPSMLAAVVASGALEEKGRLSSLRTILFAGEVFPMRHLRRLRSQVAQAELFNLFGPTETNVCTYHQVGELPQSDSCRLPIGRACEGTEIWVRKSNGSRAGPGESGELMVRGPCLMNGYWNQPGRTAETLLPDESGRSGDRVYRTGDWVKMDETGTLSFLGRHDEMVKRRGYRIELGEIEAALASHADILEVAVIDSAQDAARVLIKAFIVGQPGSTLGVSEAQEICRTRLPSYMIPDLFELRPRLPHTSTGKVDKASLRQQSTEG